MKSLLILSGKGGTGKTTIAGAFIKLSHAKAYADCDVDAPNLHLIMAQETEPLRSNYNGLGKAIIASEKCNLCGICEKNCRFDAIQRDNAAYRVDAYACEGCGVCEATCPKGAIQISPFVAGECMLYQSEAVFSTAQLKMGSGTSGKLVTQVKQQLNVAKDSAEFAIIDGSPGIGCPVIASLAGVDMVLVVTEPSRCGISDMERIILTAKKFNVMIVVCVNKYDTNIENTIKIEKLCQAQELLYVGRIPYDYHVMTALSKGDCIIGTDCAAAEAIKRVYEKTFAHFAGGAKR